MISIFATPFPSFHLSRHQMHYILSTSFHRQTFWDTNNTPVRSTKTPLILASLVLPLTHFALTSLTPHNTWKGMTPNHHGFPSTMGFHKVQYLLLYTLFSIFHSLVRWQCFLSFEHLFSSNPDSVSPPTAHTDFLHEITIQFIEIQQQ